MGPSDGTPAASHALAEALDEGGTEFALVAVLCIAQLMVRVRLHLRDAMSTGSIPRKAPGSHVELVDEHGLTHVSHEFVLRVKVLLFPFFEIRREAADDDLQGQSLCPSARTRANREPLP